MPYKTVESFMNLRKAITLVITGAFLLTSALFAEEIKGDRQAGKTGPSRLARLGDDGPKSTFFNINSWSIQVEHQGFFQWNGTSHGSAGDYPKGMANVIFAEGILWGVRADDKYGVDADGQLLTDGTGAGTPKIRVNGSMYNTGLKSGKVLLDASGAVNKTGYSEDWRNTQIWRVRRDWEAGDLTSDVAIIKNIGANDVTEAQIAATKAQYKHDWEHWPVAKGAPYDDVNGDGTFTAATWNTETLEWDGDIPGIPGADQTIWLVANDLPDENDPNYPGKAVSVSEGGWGSPPIGFEMQMSMWGYDYPFSNPLSSMFFKRARMIYVGLPGGPATAKLDTVYFTQWSDPDLGTYTDDYVGCDTTLSLGYVYNGNTFDETFFDNYGSPVPAGGYDFLEGPKVDADGDGPGTAIDTLGMTSFVYFAAGSSVSDPSTRVYAGTLQWFNLMEGFLPRPPYPTQNPFVDPLTGLAEIFVLAGDPPTGTGWIDGIILPPGDRRLVMNTGPFTMALGDTQDVVIGLIGGMGGDNLSSVTVLKYNDIFAQFAYDNDFSLPTPPTPPVVSAFEGDGYITLNWAETAAYNKTESVVNKGFAFEGYKVYQLPNPLAAGSDGALIAQYDLANGVMVITEKAVDPATGLVLEKPAHVGSDNGISRVVVIKTDALRNRPITNDRPYHYGISAYSYLPDNEFSPFKSLESSMTRVSVTPKLPDPGKAYTVDSGDYMDMTHTAGTSDGQARIEVIDPGVVTGHTYEVSFATDEASGNILWNVTDATSGSEILSDYTQGSLFTDPGFPAADGLTFKVTGPPNAFKNFLVTAHGGGAQDPPLQGAQDWGGFPVTYTGRVNQSNGTGWFFHGGGAGGNAYDVMISRIIRGSKWTYLIPNDFEYRFTYELDNYAYLAYTTWSLIRVPFEMWNITQGYRLCPWSYDYDGNEIWGLHPNDHPGSGGANDPYTDWIYPRLPANWATAGNAAGDDETGYQEWLAASIAAGIASGGPATPDANGSYLTGATGSDFWVGGSYGPELMGRNVWFAWNLDDVSDGTIDVDDPAKLLPEKGTVVLITTNKTNQPADVFSVEAPKVESTSVADDVKRVNVFPNPYLGYHDLETASAELPAPKYVTLNHLPTTGKVVFRVFNMAGVMVANFEKSTTTQYQNWNMRNANQFPLASGIYIVHIDMGSAGTKVLKLALVTEEEWAKRY